MCVSFVKIPEIFQRAFYTTKRALTLLKTQEILSMSITLKTEQDLQGMRVAGKLAASVLEMLTPHVKPGITTEHLDQLAHDYILEHGATPAPLNYHGFPKSICTSLNHQVCHGIPGNKKLKNGDILNIDITVIKDGYHGDTSMMFCVGDKVPAYAKRLCDVARECLWLGIEQVKPGNTLFDVACAIEAHAHKHGYSVVEEYCGHGIGQQFHEEPQVLHYAEPSLKQIQLVPGMTFTIEPMINQGRKETRVLGDQWTVITKDRKLSAQWEHTLAVTEQGYEIFTLREGETPFLPGTHL